MTGGGLMPSFSWGSLLAFAGVVLGSAGIGGLLKTWLDYIRGRRSASDDVAMSLVKQLNRRVRVLERTNAVERAGYEATTTITRHKMANLKQCFDALLMLVKADPTRAAEFVVLVEEMRARQEAQETIEKATIEAARIAAAAAYDISNDADDDYQGEEA